MSHFHIQARQQAQILYLWQVLETDLFFSAEIGRERGQHSLGMSAILVLMEYSDNADKKNCTHLKIVLKSYIF